MTTQPTARPLMLASADPQSGKSAIAVSLLSTMQRTYQKVGVFRPIVRSDGVRDHVLQMLLETLGDSQGYQDAVGVTYAEVIADPHSAMSTMVDRYFRLAERCQAVLIVGSDYTDVAGPMEFGYNAQIAANLAAPLILVVNGDGRSPGAIAGAADVALADARLHHAAVSAVIANRVDPLQWSATEAALAAVGPVSYVVPDVPALAATSVRQLATAVDGRMVAGSEAALDADVLDLAIAATTLPSVLAELTAGACVVTGADRLDVLLGILLSQKVGSFPELAACVVTGAEQVPSAVTALAGALGSTLPVIAATGTTMSVLEKLQGATRQVAGFSVRKIDAARRVVAEHIDGPALVANTLAGAATTPLFFEHALAERARAANKHIVLPEGTEPRVLAAVDFLLRRQICRITLLGDPAAVRAAATDAGADISGADIIDPATSPLLPQFAATYAELRKHKKVPYDQALDHCSDVSYFGTMMVLDGLADGMVSGAVHTTAHTIRPALEVIKTVPGTSVVSSVFFMCLADRVLVYGDCAVNPDPSAEQLADIAISSAATAREFGIEPKIAMLSYSTGSSGTGADVDKVRMATELVRQKAPELLVEGPIQYDAAVDPAVAATKLKDSPVAGKATVFIFPDLNTGNNTYKAVQRSAGAVAIGPVLQGLRKPVNDLSRGALVTDIINTVAITAIQAAGKTL